MTDANHEGAKFLITFNLPISLSKFQLHTEDLTHCSGLVFSSFKNSLSFKFFAYFLNKNIKYSA